VVVGTRRGWPAWRGGGCGLTRVRPAVAVASRGWCNNAPGVVPGGTLGYVLDIGVGGRVQRAPCGVVRPSRGHGGSPGGP
jgi:hypothetical protein